jgi:hypothetical protein
MSGSVVFHGKEHRVFQNKLLRKVSGRNRKEATGDWTEVRNEEQHDLYYSSNITLLIIPMFTCCFVWV